MRLEYVREKACKAYKLKLLVLKSKVRYCYSEYGVVFHPAESYVHPQYYGQLIYEQDSNILPTSS